MTMTRDELIQAIEDTKDELENFEMDPDNLEDSYGDMLNELYPVHIGGIPFDASKILEEFDPIAYRCGLLDYVDGMDVTDDPGYQELQEELEELEAELEELEED